MLIPIPLPDTTSDPVIIAEPLYGNPVPEPAYVAYDAVVANEDDVGMNVILVAADADTAFDAQLAVPTNVPKCEPVKEPVNASVNVLNCVELDIILFGNPNGFTYEAVVVNEDVVAKDAVFGIKVIELAADAVVANEPLIAFCVQLLVPNSDPVIPPRTCNDPVN